MRSHDKLRRQKTPSGASRQAVAVNPRETDRGGPSSLSAPPQTPSCADDLMEVMLERTNMWRAIKHVEANKGAAGMDHVTVADLRSYRNRPCRAYHKRRGRGIDLATTAF